MPINVFGNSSSSYDNSDKIGTRLFVQKPYLRSNCIGSNIEENIDLKNQYRIKFLPDPISIREAASKSYVDDIFNDPSIMKNIIHVDFNDKNLNKIHSVKVNSFPTLEEQLTPKIFVDQAISNGVARSSLFRLEVDEKLKVDEQDSIVLNSTLTLPKTIIKLPTKSYVGNKITDPSIIKKHCSC